MTATADKAPVQKTKRFRERATHQSTPLVVDKAAGIIKDVLVLGTASRGMGVYPAPVMQAAVQKYEGMPTFVNHTRDGSHPSYDNKLGVHRNPHMSPEGIRTDFHFNPEHRCASQLVWDAENDPRNVGFSHDADCAYEVQNGKRVVRSIDKVYSIDLVTRPGTTGGLFEEEEQFDGDPKLKALAVSTLAAMDNTRTILFAPDEDLADKRSRLLEAAIAMQSELREGEIADEIRQTEQRRLMRKINETANDFICSAMWDDNLSLAGKKERILAVLADWEKEISALSATAAGTTFKEDEAMAGIELKDLTVDQLTKERPDLVAVLKGTDEKSRLIEEAKTLTEQVKAKDAELATFRAKESERVRRDEIAAELTAANFPVADALVNSAKFQEQLLLAPDKAARAEIISDRLSLAKGRMQEQAAMVPPMADLRPAAPASTTANPQFNSLFGG